jgi:hypothetical protein
MKIPINHSEKEEPTFDFTTIKTFEDACERLRLDPSNLPNLSALPKRFKKGLYAYYKLMVIFEAINDGWIPDFENKNQCKFFPIFEINPSGMNFSQCKNSSIYNLAKTSSFLCCGNQDKSVYISSQFTELFKDYLLINRSLPDQSTSEKQYPSKRMIVRARHVYDH